MSLTRRRFAGFRLFPFVITAILLTVLIIVVGPVAPAHAATYTVSKTADTNDGTCNADCSLREAIAAANASAGDDIIGFSGVTLVNIDAELEITSNITINGTGVTVDNTGTGRVFLMTN